METPLRPSRIWLDNGILSPSTSIKRTLKDLYGFFADKQATESVLRTGQDPIIYEVYECLHPRDGGHVNYGTTILYPGKIGKEFYMTKGHFHLKEESSEVYLGIDGEGLILLQTRTGNSEYLRMGKGDVIYVPPGWGHRAVNSGTQRLVFFFAYQSDAGHDYESVLQRGFPMLAVEEHGKVKVVGNPNFVTQD